MNYDLEDSQPESDDNNADNTREDKTQPSGCVPLDRITGQIWKMLRQAVSDKAHPYRTPVIATLDSDGPQARIVVLRKTDAERRQLEFHTDFRSNKISQLGANETIVWVFYDAALKIQIRARGSVHVHHENDYSRRCWADLTDYQKRPYSQIAPPGQRITGDPGEPPKGGAAELQSGRANFAVVSSCIDEFDWLQLARSGDRRAVVVYTSNDWSAQWLMP